MSHTKNYIDKDYTVKRSELLKHCLFIEVDVKIKLIDFLIVKESINDIREKLIFEKRISLFDKLLKNEKIKNKEDLITYIVSTSMYYFLEFKKLIKNRLFQDTLTHNSSTAFKQVDLVRKIRNSVSHTRKCHKSHLTNAYNNIVKPNVNKEEVFSAAINKVKEIRNLLK